MRWPWQRKEPTRTCWVWCPVCKRDLNGDDLSFLSDDHRGVRYGCLSCESVSVWDFDCPAPVLLRMETRAAGGAE